MLCKIAEPDIVADNLIWQQIGPPNVSAPNPPRQEAAPPSVLTTPVEQENGVLKRRIAELEARRNSEVEQARQSGLEQGMKQARQEVGAEMEAALDRLARTIQEVAQVKRRVRSEAETELVKLSLAIARRVLHRELTTDPQSLRGVIYAALQRLQNREITRIRVFPAAVPAVRAALERNGGMAAIEIIADGMLAPGGLIFETSLGELDASVDTQLQEIERGFTDRLQLRS